MDDFYIPFTAIWAAKRAAAYYQRILREGIPEQLAVHLAASYHQSVLAEERQRMQGRSVVKQIRDQAADQPETAAALPPASSEATPPLPA